MDSAKLHVGEQGGHLKGQAALIVRDQRTRLGGYIFRRLIAVLTLVAAFNQVAEADVTFGIILQIIWGGHAGIQAGILLFRRPSGKYSQSVKELDSGAGWPLFPSPSSGRSSFERDQDIVIVLERQLNGFVQRDPHGAARGLAECRGCAEDKTEQSANGQSGVDYPRATSHSIRLQSSPPVPAACRHRSQTKRRAWAG